MGSFFCKFGSFTALLNLNSSTLILAMMAVDRYLALRVGLDCLSSANSANRNQSKPNLSRPIASFHFRTRKMCIICCLLCWLLSLAASKGDFIVSHNIWTIGIFCHFHPLLVQLQYLTELLDPKLISSPELMKQLMRHVQRYGTSMEPGVIVFGPFRNQIITTIIAFLPVSYLFL